jgi:hypothetical protein
VVPLIGKMGAAETTVGRGVVARAGRAFWDSDLATDVTGDVLADRQRVCNRLPDALSGARVAVTGS